MALAAFDTFVCVESTNATTFCCLDRLAIHDNNRRTSRPASLHASLLADQALDATPHTADVPAPEIVINSCSRPEILGEAIAIGSPSAVDKRSRSKQRRRSVVRGRPPGRGAGNIGSINLQAFAQICFVAFSAIDARSLPEMQPFSDRHKIAQVVQIQF